MQEKIDADAKEKSVPPTSIGQLIAKPDNILTDDISASVEVLKSYCGRVSSMILNGRQQTVEMVAKLNGSNPELNSLRKDIEVLALRAEVLTSRAGQLPEELKRKIVNQLMSILIFLLVLTVPVCSWLWLKESSDKSWIRIASTPDQETIFFREVSAIAANTNNIVSRTTINSIIAKKKVPRGTAWALGESLAVELVDGVSQLWISKMIFKGKLTERPVAPNGESQYRVN